MKKKIEPEEVRLEMMVTFKGASARRDANIMSDVVTHCVDVMKERGMFTKKPKPKFQAFLVKRKDK